MLIPKLFLKLPWITLESAAETHGRGGDVVLVTDVQW